MDRFWFLTSTTYGTWLPGDRRGFVSNVCDGPGPEVRHNLPGTEYEADLPALEVSARNNLRGEPIYLNLEQAEILSNQFQETANFRGWTLLGFAIMRNHFHLLAGVTGDPNPEKLLDDFESYGSRALNRCWGKPKGGTWWTESGSKRKLPNEIAVKVAIQYIRDQPSPLVIWFAQGY